MTGQSSSGDLKAKTTLPCNTTQREKKNVAVAMTISARLISCVHSLFPFLSYSKVVIRCDGGEQVTS